MKQKLLEDLKQIRKNDFYGNSDLEIKLKDLLFPTSTEELTLDLSNVTSAFYGLMLKNIGNEIGLDKIDEISKSTFYDLGKAKSEQCQIKMNNIAKDTTTYFIVLASAIFNASPEYTFKIIEFTKEITIFELNGVDRYLRILKELEISDYVTFPTLIPFMEGIKDYFEINSTIEYDLQYIEGTNETKCIYKFNLL
jgi:hypothetical protein